jgi:excisionase family DNA binding protein
MPAKPPVRPDTPELLTIRQVAEIVGVSDKTVRRWIARGDLHAWQRDRIVRVDRRELQRFLKA